MASITSFSLTNEIARLTLSDSVADFQAELRTLEQNLNATDILKKVIALRECYKFCSSDEGYYEQWNKLFTTVVYKLDWDQKPDEELIQRLLHLGLIDQATLLRQMTDCPERAGGIPDRVVAAAFKALHHEPQNAGLDPHAFIATYISQHNKLQRLASLEMDQLLQELEISPAQIRDCVRSYEKATKSTPPFSGEAFENLKIKLAMLSDQVDKSVDPTVPYHPKRMGKIPPFDCLLNFLAELSISVEQRQDNSALGMLIPTENEEKVGVVQTFFRDISPYLLFPLVEEKSDYILEQLPTSEAFIEFACRSKGAASRLAEMRAHDVIRLFSNKDELQKLAEVHVGIVYMLASKEPRLISKFFFSVAEVARFALIFRQEKAIDSYDELNIINGLKICMYSDNPEIANQASGMKEGSSRFVQLKSGSLLWRAIPSDSPESYDFVYSPEDISLEYTDKFGRPAIQSLQEIVLKQDAWFLQTAAIRIPGMSRYLNREVARQLLFIEENTGLNFVLTDKKHCSDLLQKQNQDAEAFVYFLQTERAIATALITLLDMPHAFNELLESLKEKVPAEQLPRLYTELEYVVTEAVRRHDTKVIQSVYAHFPELPNFEWVFYNTIGNIDLMNFFISRGGNPVWLQDRMLEKAVSIGCVEALQTLLSIRGDLSVHCTRPTTLLQTAIDRRTSAKEKNHKQKFFRIIQILLESGADTGLALSRTLETGDTDVMQLLLDKGVKPKDDDEKRSVEELLELDKHD